jgi:hypothetical protein
MILWICMEQETPVLVRVVVLSFLKVDYEDHARTTRMLLRFGRKVVTKSSGLLRCVLDVASLE